MKFKTHIPGLDECAAARCTKPSTILVTITRSMNSPDPRIGLCDDHWKARCEEEQPQQVETEQ